VQPHSFWADQRYLAGFFATRDAAFWEAYEEGRPEREARWTQYEALHGRGPGFEFRNPTFLEKIGWRGLSPAAQAARGVGACFLSSFLPPARPLIPETGEETVQEVTQPAPPLGSCTRHLRERAICAGRPFPER